MNVDTLPPLADPFDEKPTITPYVPAPAPPAEQLKLVRVEAKPIDVAGKHSVRLRRAGDRVERIFYLDDEATISDFVEEAMEKFYVRGEDFAKLRSEIHQLLRTELWDYERYQTRVVLEPLSQAMPYEVDWLWPGRIAANKLTMLVGDPGVGKSLVSLDVAARVSTGRPWPDEPANTERRDPGGVLLLSELDDADDTIRPRLQALGADLQRITLIRSFIRAGENGATQNLPFSVGGKLEMLEACLQKVPDCKLIIIDPLSAYVETNYARRELSALLQELVEIAVSKSVAILVVSHFSRGSHALFHYGSQANSRFVAGARSVWKIVGDSEHRDRRLLLPMKNNLGSDWLGLGFRIESAPDDPAPSIVWENQPLEIAVERSNFKPDLPALPNSHAVYRRMIHEWLRNQLQTGDRFAQDILAAAAVAKIGEKTLRKALREIGGMTRKGSTGVWVWSLTDQSGSDSCHQAISCATEKSVCQVDRLDRLDQVDRLEATEAS